VEAAGAQDVRTAFTRLTQVTSEES
jgi:hypothetical protein